LPFLLDRPEHRTERCRQGEGAHILLLPRPLGVGLGSTTGKPGRGRGAGVSIQQGASPASVPCLPRRCIAASLCQAKRCGLLAPRGLARSHGEISRGDSIGILLLEASCDMGLGRWGVPSFEPRGCTKGENLLLIM